MFEGVLPVLLLGTQVLLQQAEDVAGLQDTDESGGYDYLILNVLNLKFLLSGAMFVVLRYPAYPGLVLLQCSQVALQSQAAAFVEQSLHPGHVGLHQLLPFAGRLLLQGLHFLLETLCKHTQITTCRSPKGQKTYIWMVYAQYVHVSPG